MNQPKVYYCLRPSRTSSSRNGSLYLVCSKWVSVFYSHYILKPLILCLQVYVKCRLFKYLYCHSSKRISPLWYWWIYHNSNMHHWMQPPCHLIWSDVYLILATNNSSIDCILVSVIWVTFLFLNSHEVNLYFLRFTLFLLFPFLFWFLSRSVDECLKN